MTTTPAISQYPHTALELLFGPVGGATAQPGILSPETNENLGRALENLQENTRETAVKEVRTATAELLDISLVGMLIEGWREYRDLTSAARRTLAAPGSSELVDLATHRVTVAQRPQVKVLVDGHPVATIQLTLSVVFDVSALLAGISAGLLVAVHAGRCVITGTLAVDGVTVASRQARLELPGVIPVTPGVRLLPARDYPVGAGQAPPVSLAGSGTGQALPAAAGVVGGQPGRKRARWWDAGKAAAPSATTAPPSATTVPTPANTVPTPTAPSATPPTATPEKTGPSKRWWER